MNKPQIKISVYYPVANNPVDEAKYRSDAKQRVQGVVDALLTAYSNVAPRLLYVDSVEFRSEMDITFRMEDGGAKP